MAAKTLYIVQGGKIKSKQVGQIAIGFAKPK
jgi:hypothetical protein